MEDWEIRAALDAHWAASDANDFELEHQIYREDAMLEYPQSAERGIDLCRDGPLCLGDDAQVSGEIGQSRRIGVTRSWVAS